VGWGPITPKVESVDQLDVVRTEEKPKKYSTPKNAPYEKIEAYYEVDHEVFM
jgi:hypothetical protein